MKINNNIKEIKKKKKGGLYYQAERGLDILLILVKKLI